MNDKQTILVVDDDLHIREVLEARLSSAGFRVLTAAGARKALGILNDKQVDLMISDVRMPGMGGMELLREVRVLRPELPVILLTAYGTIPDAIHAIKAGAVEYLTKPFKGRDFLLKVNEILGKVSSSTKGATNSALNKVPYDGKSDSMKALYDLVERVTPSDINVLILGESGVGKDRIARMIHQKGPRRDVSLV
ncbi:MAG: sigma-54-dependent Fis family transcriptional regulator [Deltaproteobacteria bacterium]|nr:sigma-54-dependent Fis family transcriptional regulator [Deltaproteobacteria bacterium]